MNDRALLKLLKEDKNAGMDQVIRQYSGCVYAVVRGKLCEACDSSEIEDCVCDVFIVFSSSVDGFTPRASLKTYLCVIAKNTANKYIRDRIDADSVDDDDFFLDIPDDANVEDEVAQKELLSRISGEIRDMGHPDSDIIFRRFYLGQSSKQIAQALDITVSNVDTRLHRAIKRLKNKFGGENE